MAELPKIDLKYLKEAFKEPINFWGMAGFAVAAAYVQDVTPLVAALANFTNRFNNGLDLMPEA